MDQIALVFIWMHPMNVLLEVVKPWPYLFSVSASFRSTLPGIGQHANPVDALLVAHKVIISRKAFTASLAVWHIALEGLIMLKHMLSARFRLAAAPQTSIDYALVIGSAF